MSDPSLELQGAVVTALRAAGVAEGRVYDSVTPDAPFPFVSMGPSDAVPDDAECVDGWIVTMQIDAWSRKTGYPEVRAVAGAVHAALHRADLDLAGAHLTDMAVRQIRYARDPDGITSRAIIEVRALIESE